MVAGDTAFHPDGGCCHSRGCCRALVECKVRPFLAVVPSVTGDGGIPVEIGTIPAGTGGIVAAVATAVLWRVMVVMLLLVTMIVAVVAALVMQMLLGRHAVVDGRGVAFT